MSGELGDCFVRAYRYFSDNQRSLGSNAFLVHGLVSGQGKLTGIVFCHAWVEVGDTVVDMTQPPSMQKLPKLAYYALGQIRTVFRYDFQQVMKKSLQYQTYGPWESVLLNNPY